VTPEVEDQNLKGKRRRKTEKPSKPKVNIPSGQQKFLTARLAKDVLERKSFG
jgi:hypothetical protein